MNKVTTEELHKALDAQGIETEIDFDYPVMKMGKLTCGPIEIAIDGGRAFVQKSCFSRCGHKRSRLPSHPLYPALIMNSKIVAIEKVIKDLSEA